MGQPPAGSFPGGSFPGGSFPGGSLPGGPGAGPDAGLDTATADYLVANQGSARWIVAVTGANTAGLVELATGRAVMAMGGFTGSDNSPTLAQLQAYIAGGDLRFVQVGGGEGGGPGGPGGGGPGGVGQGGQGASSEISTWVTSACTAVSVGGSTTSVYDCAAAVSG